MQLLKVTAEFTYFLSSFVHASVSRICLLFANLKPVNFVLIADNGSSAMSKITDALGFVFHLITP